MMSNELSRDFADVFRTVLRAIQLQQDLLDGLFRSHAALIDALRSEMSASHAPTFDSKSVERAKAEIAKLEQIFELAASPPAEPKAPASELEDTTGSPNPTDQF